MRREKRRAALKRRTRGTEVEIELRLDGSGRTAIDTPFQPLNELLTLMAAHSGLDLRLVQLANRHADDPYALDDLATGLAEGFRRAVGLRPRVRQFASAIVPVGDALVLAAIDLVSPPVFLFGATFDARRSGDMDPALIERFLATFIDRLGAGLHLRVLAGVQEENRMRAVFIALGRCLSEACLEMERDGAREVALDLDYSEGVGRPPSGDRALDEAVIEELVPASEMEDEPAARVADEALPRERRAGRERGRGREGRESGEGREGREGRERGRPERGRRRELPSRTAPAAEAELELPGMHLEPVVEEFGELADLPDLADYPDLQPREAAIPERGGAEFDEGDLEGRSESRRRRRGRRGGRGRRRGEPEPATAEAGAGDAIGGEARAHAAEPPELPSPFDQEGGEEEEAFVPAYPRGRSPGREAGRPGRGEPRGDRMRRERGRPERGTEVLGEDVAAHERDRDERDRDERGRDERGRDRQEVHDADESFTPGPIDGEEPARGRDSRRRSSDLSSQSFGRGRKSALAVRPAAADEPVEKLEPRSPFPADADADADADEEEIAPFRPGARSRSPEETAEPIPAEESDGVLDFISRPKESPAPESPRAMARTRRRRR